MKTEAVQHITRGDWYPRSAFVFEYPASGIRYTAFSFFDMYIVVAIDC